MSEEQKCLCTQDDMELLWVQSPAGSMRGIRIIEGRCRKCRRVWKFRTVGKNGLILLKPEEAHENKPAPIAGCTSDVVLVWERLTQMPAPPVPPGLLDALCTVKEGQRGLVYGFDIAALAINRGGDRHVVMTDNQTVITTLAPELTRVDFRPRDWLPEYGTTYTGMIFGEFIPDQLRQTIIHRLAPKGDVFLLGEAEQHIEELSAAWGMKAVRFNKKQAAQYVWLSVPPEPLGEGPGTELHQDLHDMGMPVCQQCYDLALRMNKWGVQGCRDNLDKIANEMLPRAREWWMSTEWRGKMDAWFKSRKSMLTAFTQAWHYGKMQRDKEVARAELDQLLIATIKEQVASAIARYQKKTRRCSVST